MTGFFIVFALKKFLLGAALLLIATASVSAQETKMYAGGSLLLSNYTAKATNGDKGTRSEVSLAPEFGYNLNDKFSVGCSIDFDINKLNVSGTKSNTTSFKIYPYVRYHALEFGGVSFFADGRLGFGTTKNLSGLSVGVLPGMSIKLSEAFSFVAHLGYVGLDTNYMVNAESATQLQLLLFNTPTFGLYYNF